MLGQGWREGGTRSTARRKGFGCGKGRWLTPLDRTPGPAEMKTAQLCPGGVAFQLVSALPVGLYINRALDIPLPRAPRC